MIPLIQPSNPVEESSKNIEIFQSSWPPTGKESLQIYENASQAPKKARIPATGLGPLPPSVLVRDVMEMVRLLKGIDQSFAPLPGRVTGDFSEKFYEREAQAKAIVRRNIFWPPIEGQVFAIQIDQDNPPSPPNPLSPGSPPEAMLAWEKAVKVSNDYLIKYTGHTVVFLSQREGNGMRLVELNPDGPFLSAAHPGQAWGDGLPVAWLRSHAYTYKNCPTCYMFPPLEDKTILVARDLNYDGAIDLDESIRAPHESLSYGTAILFHAGFPESPRSIGCQTFPPSDFDEFFKTVVHTGVETFTYILVRRPNDLTGENVW